MDIYRLFILCNNNYFDDDSENDSEIDYCVICLDKLEPSTHFKSIDYKTYCNCKPVVHTTCLNMWIERSNSCVICRKTMFKYNNYPKYSYCESCIRVLCYTVSVLLLLLSIYDIIVN